MATGAWVHWVVSLVLLGCSAGGSGSIAVGEQGSGGGGIGGGASSSGGAADFGTDASVARPSALSAHIESPPGMTVTFVTLSCDKDCADVLAVAKGGNQPYRYQWEDGSSDPSRRVCAKVASSFQVTVTDTAVTTGEFKRPASTATATLTANVMECPADGGSAPACHAGASGEALSLDPAGSVRYFAGGAALPAGRYRVEYVDGCMKYGSDIGGTGTWGWTIHSGVLPINPALSGFPHAGECVLVGDATANVIATLPGTTGTPGHATYAECVTDNRAATTPLVFDFSGGKLGLFVEDLLAFDDVGGQAEGGVAPTYRLTKLGACP